MSSKQKGILCIILSALCFAFMNVFVRLSGDLPSVQKSFFRNFVAMLFALILLAKKRPEIKLNRQSTIDIIMRSICGTLGILCNFYAVDHLVLADASMLNKMSPFFAVIFSVVLLNEKATKFQWGAIITAFIGCIFILKPSPSQMAFFPAVIGLLGGMGAGIAYTFVRKLGKQGVPGPFIVFFFSAFSCVVTLPYLILNYNPMTTHQLCMLLLAGLSAAGGQFSITAAYTHAPAAEISIYDYSQIIFAAFLGFVIFGQIPDVLSVIGYIIVCSAAIAVFIYNNKRTA